MSVDDRVVVSAVISSEEHLPKATAAALRIATFFAGGILMSLEILGFRIIGKTFGSALRDTSVVIAVFLTAMSLGYYVGGRFADRRPHLKLLLITLAIASGTIATIPIMDRFVAPSVFSSSLPLALHSTVVTISLFFIPTAFLASVSPIAIRLLSRTIQRSGTTAGSLSAISTIGSIVGSIGTAFVLIDYFESVYLTVYALAIMTAILLAATAATHYLAGSAATDSVISGARRSSSVTMGALVGIGLLVTAATFILAQPFGFRRLLTGTDNEAIFQRDSTYHRITVRDHNRTRTLYFDVHPQTQMSLDDPVAGGFPYTNVFHIPMLLNPDIKRVLFIGVGGGTGPRTFVHDYPNVLLDGVDVDPVVLEVAERFFGLKGGPRIRLHAEDGRQFLKRSKETYDLIVLDAYSANRYGATIPAHLTTREFFAEAAERLSPHGMLMFNCADSPQGALTRSLSKTLYRSFQYQISFFTGSNTVLLASGDDIRLSSTAIAERATRASESGHVMNRAVQARAHLLLHPVEVIGGQVLLDDYAPVDHLVKQ